MDRNLIFPRSLRYLMAVAEHQSFTRAAEALYVSQPTLSQQIKQLEDLLEVQLLDRSGRNVRLTAAGEVYLQHAHRALVELNAGSRAIYELHDLTRGSLRLGMTPISDYLATPLLDQFNSRYPGITVSTLEMPQSDIEAALADDKVDIGIAFGSAASSTVFSEEIDTHIMFIESLNLAVGKGHRLAGQTRPLNGEILEQEPLVLFHQDYALRRHIDQYCLEQSISPRIVMEATSLSVIIEMVRRGRLATILPETIAHSQQGLHSVPLQPGLPRHTITLICRKGAYKSPACLAFGELAAEWSAARCQLDGGKPFEPLPLPEDGNSDDLAPTAEVGLDKATSDT